MFVRNQWYVAAWSDEVERAIFTCRLLEERMLIYRTEAGSPVVLRDLCPHRLAPLSCGGIKGDNIYCGYHGLTFAPDGSCVHVPGQETIPQGASVQRYPAVDRWGWIWVWMGEAERADPKLIPDLPWLDDPQWRVVRFKRLVVEASYQLVIDNLLELSHETYVHPATVGADHVVNTPITTSAENGRVKVVRQMNDQPAVPLYAKLGGFNGHVDRWQEITYLPPAFVTIDAGSCPPGAPNRAGSATIMINHPIVPETETRAHFYLALARNVALDDETTDQYLLRAVGQLLDEDVAIIERQQRTMLENPGASPVAIRADAGVVQARRLMSQLLAAEAS